MKDKERLLKSLSDFVLEMEDDKVISVAEEYISQGYPPLEGILNGLVDGMNKAAVLYEEEEYFIPELMICSEAMYNGLSILRPHLEQNSSNQKGTAVIGVVEGDTHDIGKNLVKIMLESAGYEIIDLGRDVPATKFIEVIKETKSKILALSTLMTTSMENMENTIKLLEKEGLRNDVKVIIGGAPVSQAFANKIGADGYSRNAVEAVKLVNQLLNF